MSDRDRLLGSILTQPGEDTPRLALADWLDEWGGCADRARAEFIRIQIERSRGDVTAPGPREHALLTRWGCEWLPKIAPASRSRRRIENPFVSRSVILAVPGGSELIYFARGFPDRYALIRQSQGAVAAFAKRAAALFAAASVGCFELEVERCEPWVEVRVAPTRSRRRKGWRAELYVRAGGPVSGAIDELLAPDRQTLAGGFERWLRRALADVCFELTEDETSARAGLLVR